MASDDFRLLALSRKTTRVAVESQLKTPNKNGNQSRTPHLGLTLPARSTGSRLSRQKVRHFDPEEEYKFDSSDDEDTALINKAGIKPVPPTNRGVDVYRKLCAKYGKIPILNVCKQFGRRRISLKGFNLSQRELKAFFVALLEYYVNDDNDSQRSDDNDELSALELDGNRILPRQVNYVIDFASAHRYLVQLNLVGCQLCWRGVSDLARFIRTNKTLRHIDLSDNDLTDNAAQSIADIIKNGDSISELALRGNKLEDGGTVIGQALRVNDTLRLLDLSWNHLRGHGAIGLCKGLQVNRGLETLLLGWNGFGFEGSTAMAYALADNTTLCTLDLTSNRIHPPALFELIKGIEKNKTLSVLRLSQNPITASMTSVLLTKIYLAKESSLKELDLLGIIVDKEFEKILKEIQDSRLFIVRFDQSLPLNKGPVSQIDPKNIFNIDPIRILFYMKEHLRTIDLFMKVDKDGSNSLTREEMKFAFEMEGFPISDKALDQVMSYLDTNKDGEVDFLLVRSKLDREISRLQHEIDYRRTKREFINGERRLKRQLIKEHEDEIIAEKEQDKKYSQTFTSQKAPKKLPPLNGPKMS